METHVKTVRNGAYLVIAAALLLSIPKLPSDLVFEEYSLPDPPSFEGKLAVNDALNGATKLFENEVHAPESLVVYNGVLYTGLADGRVVAVKDDTLYTIANLGRPCDQIWDKTKCGRALGVDMDKHGNLFAIDCYHGIYKVNTTTGDFSLIIPLDKPIAGQMPLLPNNIAVGPDEAIYWSDTSTKFPLHKLLFIWVGDKSGRLIRSNQTTGESEVLMEDLAFSNGVYVSRDGSYVAVVETIKSRVHRYWLKGPKKGTSEIFLDNLPGVPDNIVPYKNGGFVVSLILTREAPDIPNYLAPFPRLRQIISRFGALLEMVLQKIQDVYPTNLCKKMIFYMAHHDSTAWFIFNTHGIALVYDDDGNLVKSLHSTDGILPYISDVVELDGHYYVGSPYNSFIGKVPIRNT
nr:PREDICTED: adipocyte plasma membrane-associated protein-like [Bemisia tabaci]